MLSDLVISRQWDFGVFVITKCLCWFLDYAAPTQNDMSSSVPTILDHSGKQFDSILAHSPQVRERGQILLYLQVVSRRLLLRLKGVLYRLWLGLLLFKLG